MGICKDGLEREREIIHDDSINSIPINRRSELFQKSVNNSKISDNGTKNMRSINNFCENNISKSINKNKDDIEREKHIQGRPSSLSVEQMKKIFEQMEKSVCKIEKKKETGTGFLCSIPFPDKLHPLPVLITCHHILKNEEIKRLKGIVLTFKQNKKIINFDKPRKIYESNIYY